MGVGEAENLEKWATKERVRKRRYRTGDPRLEEQG